jgi:hypothetical protein
LREKQKKEKWFTGSFQALNVPLVDTNDSSVCRLIQRFQHVLNSTNTVSIIFVIVINFMFQLFTIFMLHFLLTLENNTVGLKTELN